ncbi:MBL fold metallo-hydrolase [Candidatus Uhrbacteria bacterium]|nr:MBL fold metallo-hydrolase [Candidatus Uhrbacteria bacterium]
MNIIWHGNSCFRIQDSGQGREVTVVTDPFRPEGKNAPPKGLSGEILIVSRDHPRHNNVSAVAGKPFVIDGPGEYEVKEVMVSGVSTRDESAEAKDRVDNTMYYVNVADVHLLFLGDLVHPIDEKQCKDFHEIDILFVPVGGNGVLNAKQAADLVGQLEPRVIIPMHYRTGNFLPECDGVEPFLKAMGSGDIEPISRLKITGKELPQEEMRIVVLEPQ